MTSSNPKISVIIPVYGVEKYIEKSLKSLFTNTIASDCEFLIVNDATKDASISIAKKVIEQFPQVSDNIYILNHTENKGLAAARNTGLKNARGEYIITVDSDDWVEPNFLEELYTRIVAENSDICSCDYFTEYNDGVKVVKKKFTDNPIKNLELLVRKNYVRSIWANMVRRSLFEQGIEWKPGVDLGEDLLINLKLFSKARTFSYVQKPLYHYRMGNVASITHGGTKKIQQFLKLEKECSEFLEHENYPAFALMLKKDIKKSILGCCLKNERINYYKLWPETKRVSDFYSGSLKVFVFFFLMRIKLYSLCNIMIDIHQG